MKTEREILLNLDNFEGPVSLLFHLVQKCEIDIYEVVIKSIMNQFIEKIANEADPLDMGAEFISTSASLLWLKSRRLLPQSDDQKDESAPLGADDPNFEVIHHLIDYCRFKQAAHGLVSREQEQFAFYRRGKEDLGENKKGTGLKHLSLDDLALLFKQLAAKADGHKGVLKEEPWRVSDKIRLIRQLLETQDMHPFGDLFSVIPSRGELIVTFLAVLELMKLGEIVVALDEATAQLSIINMRSDG